MRDADAATAAAVKAPAPRRVRRARDAAAAAAAARPEPLVKQVNRRVCQAPASRPRRWSQPVESAGAGAAPPRQRNRRRGPLPLKKQESGGRASRLNKVKEFRKKWEDAGVAH